MKPILTIILLLTLCQVHVMGQTKVTYEYNDNGYMKHRYVSALKSLVTNEELTTSISQNEMAEIENIKEGTIDNQDIKVYPSKVTSDLNIELSGYNEGQTRVYDNQGKMLLGIALANGKNTLSLADRTPGMYIVKVKVPNLVLTYKVVKE